MEGACLGWEFSIRSHSTTSLPFYAASPLPPFRAPCCCLLAVHPVHPVHSSCYIHSRIRGLPLTSLLRPRSVHLPAVLGVRQVGLGRPGRDELQPLKLDSPRPALRGQMCGVRRLRPIHMPPSLRPRTRPSRSSHSSCDSEILHIGRFAFVNLSLSPRL